MTNATLIAKLARVIESCQTIDQLKAANKYAWLMLDRLYSVGEFWGTNQESFARMIEGAIARKARELKS